MCGMQYKFNIHCNKYNLKRHDASTSHQKNITKMKNTPKITQIISNEKHERHIIQSMGIEKRA